jgi:hypothetical protein
MSRSGVPRAHGRQLVQRQIRYVAGFPLITGSVGVSKAVAQFIGVPLVIVGCLLSNWTLVSLGVMLWLIRFVLLTAAVVVILPGLNHIAREEWQRAKDVKQ